MTDRKNIYTYGLIPILFSVLTLILTYPVIFNLSRSIIGDKSDSIFNAWILAWDVHKITSGEWWSIFDANIFYPHTNTLAYSEHMLGNVIWALPIMAISQNPVLAYNVIFLFGVIISAFSMYLLVLDLTGNTYAAVVSALIFGFFPWRFAHLAHVQLQEAQWIPLTFLFLHRFLKQGSYRDLFLFTLFFVWQFLSCGYYGVYLAFFVCLLIGLVLLQGDSSFKSLIFPLGVFAAVSALCIFPIYYPYLKVKNEMGFTRPLKEVTHFSADLFSYLCAPPINKLWGSATHGFWKPEGELFPGLTASALGITGLLSSLRGNEKPQRIQSVGRETFIRVLTILVQISFFFYGVLALVILFTGGFSTTLFGFLVSAISLERPLEILMVLGGIKLFLNRITFGRFWTFGLSFNSNCSRWYFWLLLSAFLCSLGPTIHSQGKEILHYGPYSLLHHFFPGFNGLRVPARLIIMVAFSLSVFAGFGMIKIVELFKGRLQKISVSVLLCLLILAESASFPITMTSIPTGIDIPPVYRWLSKERGDFPILELPLPKAPDEVWREAERVFFSAYHWKKLVNGYSGYFPPDYISLCQKGIRGFPSDDSIGFLRRSGIKYVVIHFEEYEKQEREGVRHLLENYQQSIRPVIHFKDDFVYELRQSQFTP